MTGHHRLRKSGSRETLIATVRSLSSILCGLKSVLKGAISDDVAQPLVRLESWNYLFFLVIQLIRRFVSTHATDVTILRSVTDFPLLHALPLSVSCSTRIATIAGVECELTSSRAHRKELLFNNDHFPEPTLVCLYIHGGGFALCTPTTHRAITQGIASRMSKKFKTNILVVAPHYRRIPENSLTEAIDDCLHVYSELERTLGRKIFVAGDSAGGALSLLLVDRMLAEDSRETSVPIGLGLLSPWCDWFASVEKESAHDYIGSAVLSSMTRLIENSSPGIRAPGEMDNFRNFPPVLIQAGSHETLINQISQFAAHCKSQDAHVVFQVYQEMIHVPHFFARLHGEADRAMDDLCRFMGARFGMEGHEGVE